MKSQSLYGPVKAFALIVILLMLVALLYSGYMSITNRTGIHQSVPHSPQPGIPTPRG